ncbi:MAG: hypothetical protein ACLFS5_13685 [Spirochaetaceae bacterium]
MKKSTFSDLGWDFDTVWDIEEDRSYPYLRWAEEEGLLSRFDTLPPTPPKDPRGERLDNRIW